MNKHGDGGSKLVKKTGYINSKAQMNNEGTKRIPNN
jgi:hypothetical protein